MENMNMGMKDMKDMKMGMVCKCPHHKVVPVIVILFGLTFLLQTTGTLTAGAVNVIWPILVIVGGVAKWMGSTCKCC